MATYVNDLRLTELATGEGSGTWGTTTNVNLELIGEALGYGTQDCFASDADATTTVADGATDPARAMYFKVTSSATLTATRTLTIAPNTVSRVMLIENATTGSQSIAISQGSGGNVTIASGQTKMVYLDGAGSGGAVVDALADLELGTITVANLTATTADINGGTIDGVTIGGSSAGAITGTNLAYTGTLTGGTGVINIGSGQVYKDASGNVGIGVSNPSVYGVFIVKSSGSSLINLDSTGGSANLTFFENGTGRFGLRSLNGSDGLAFIDGDGSTERMRIDSSGRVGIGTSSPAEQLHIANGNDAVVLIESTGSEATDDANIQLKTTNGTFTIQNDRSIGTSGALTFAGNTSNNIVIDHDSGNVGVGTSSPASSLHISQSSPVITLTDSDAAGINSQIGGSSGRLIFNADADDYGTGEIIFQQAGSEAARIDSSGNLLVGTTDSVGGVLGSSEEGISLSGQYNAIYVSRSSDVTAIFNRQTTDGEVVQFRKDGTAVGSIGTDGTTTYFAGASKALKLEATRFIPRDSDDTSADAIVDLGGSVHRFKDLYLSGGVYLGGTAAANLLDDYEEGTFTPSFGYSGGNGTGSWSYSVTEGNYTKIGRTVYFRVEIRFTGVFVKGTATGTPIIGGLPFTAGGMTNGEHYDVSFRGYNYPLTTTDGEFPGPVVSAFGSTVLMYNIRNDSSYGNMADPDSNSDLKIAGWYTTP